MSNRTPTESSAFYGFTPSLWRGLSLLSPTLDVIRPVTFVSYAKIKERACFVYFFNSLLPDPTGHLSVINSGRFDREKTSFDRKLKYILSWNEIPAFPIKIENNQDRTIQHTMTIHVIIRFKVSKGYASLTGWNSLSPIYFHSPILGEFKHADLTKHNNNNNKTLFI